MCALNIQLLRDEEVVFESERAVITTHRLLANLDKKNPDVVTDDIALSSISDFKKDSHGEHSQFGLGFKFVGVGTVLVLIQIFLPDIPSFLSAVLFLASAGTAVGGFYLILNRGLLRVKPATTVLFTVVGSRDVPVYFPGRDNPDADELTRRYVRAKRDLSLS